MAMAMPPRDMMLAVTPIMRKGMKESRTAIGMVMIGMRALGMCQRKDQDDDRNGEDHFDESGLQVVDGAKNQVGAVIDGNNLYTGGQSRLNLLYFRLDPLNHVEGILPLPHDNDPGNDLPFAIEIGNPPPDVRAEHHLPDVLDADRSAAITGHKDDILKILDGPSIASASDIVLGPAELNQPACGLGVSLAYRLCDTVDCDPIGLEPVRVDIHLILFPESSNGRYFRNPGDSLQVVTEVPVLVGAQFSQTVLSRLVHQCILEDPSKAGRVRTQFGLDAPGRLGSTAERYSKVRDLAQ